MKRKKKVFKKYQRKEKRIFMLFFCAPFSNGKKQVLMEIFLLEIDMIESKTRAFYKTKTKTTEKDYTIKI